MPLILHEATSLRHSSDTQVYHLPNTKHASPKASLPFKLRHITVIKPISSTSQAPQTIIPRLSSPQTRIPRPSSLVDARRVPGSTGLGKMQKSESMPLLMQYSLQSNKPLPAVPEAATTASPLRRSLSLEDRPASRIPRLATRVILPAQSQASLVDIRSQHRRQRIHIASRSVTTLDDEDEVKTPTSSGPPSLREKHADRAWHLLHDGTGEHTLPLERAKHNSLSPESILSMKTTMSRATVDTVLKKARSFMKIKGRGREPDFVMLDPKERKRMSVLQEKEHPEGEERRRSALPRQKHKSHLDEHQHTPALQRQKKHVRELALRSGDYVDALQTMAKLETSTRTKQQYLEVAKALSDAQIEAKEAQIEQIAAEAAAAEARQKREIADAAVIFYENIARGLAEDENNMFF